MESLAFLTTFHFPNVFLACRGAKPCSRTNFLVWSIVLILMGLSWHNHGLNSVQPYFWILIALLGLLSPLECAHLHGAYNIAMALTLLLTMWLSYQLHDRLLLLAGLWIGYVLWCLLLS